MVYVPGKVAAFKQAEVEPVFDLLDAEKGAGFKCIALQQVKVRKEKGGAGDDG